MREVFQLGVTTNTIRARSFEATLITGSYDSQTATINLVATAYYGRNLNGVLVNNLLSDLGAVQLRNVRYATFDQNLEAESKSKVTFFAGQDIDQNISVNMLTPGTSVAIDTELQPGFLDIQATNVEFNAVVDKRTMTELILVIRLKWH